MNTLDKLKQEVAGHNYDQSDPSTRTCDHSDHELGWVSRCWRADVNQFLDENSDDPSPDENPVDGLAQQIVEFINKDKAMATKYIFIAEGVDHEGKRSMYSATTKEIAIWDEMGLLKFGMSLCDAKMVTDRLRHDGVI